MKSVLVVLGLVGILSLPEPVRPGLEVLLRDSMHLVAGRRVGLVTNQGGIDRAGVHAVDVLRSAGVNLTAIFSPEHGFRGTAAPGEKIASSVDRATGLPIYSLYGSTAAPTDTMLSNVDVLLVDLPDVGTRYYTYISTTIEVMRSGAKHGRRVIVLDRPNPIGGAMQGNILDPAFRSFIGPLVVPM
ncbi:MAG: exo-beta-N-acetylmuramidase NamZ domain-containing protein, partial [Gemmatimonadales bacterium]